MKNLKRLLALASAMALMVSLTACGPNGGITSAGKDRKEPGDGRNWTRATDDAVISA